jgi:hypothetical protein
MAASFKGENGEGCMGIVSRADGYSIQAFLAEKLLCSGIALGDVKRLGQIPTPQGVRVCTGDDSDPLVAKEGCGMAVAHSATTNNSVTNGS